MSHRPEGHPALAIHVDTVVVSDRRTCGLGHRELTQATQCKG